MSYATLWWSQVKIARALSVGEGKGDVSCVARLSREGTVWRGNLEAWVSGAVKSRQMRQEGMEEEEETNEEGFGLVARILERSGREERGIGGGALGAVAAWGAMSVFSVMNRDIHSRSLDHWYSSG